jgi:hypothetical protein
LFYSFGEEDFCLNPKMMRHPSKEVFTKFDYIGVLVFAAAVITLLLGLQLGAVYTWSTSLAMAGFLYLVFSLVQWWKGADALVPWGIISNRTMFFSMAYSATLDGAYFILAYGVRVSSVSRKSQSTDT